MTANAGLASPRSLPGPLRAGIALAATLAIATLAGCASTTPTADSSSGTSSPAPTPPTAAPSKAPCTHTRLKAAITDRQGAAGHQRLDIALTDAGTTGCEVYGYPTLSLATANGTRVPLSLHHGADLAFPAVAPDA